MEKMNVGSSKSDPTIEVNYFWKKFSFLEGRTYEKVL